jgi:hypothetical protein
MAMDSPVEAALRTPKAEVTEEERKKGRKE